MKPINAITIAALLLTLIACALPAGAAPQKSDKDRANRMHHYQSEHAARLTRHKQLTPAQRHARMARYAREHQARQHRHRAHVKAQHRHEP